LNPWRTVWCVITKNGNTLFTAALVLAVAFVAERVMTHGYKFDAQWGPDRKIELAPAVPASSALLR
jgi:hypothetical protein